MEYGALVSVVMPIHNRAHLVARVVGSLCAQTYRNLEIVVADDASSDDVAGAVAALGDPRVRLVRRGRNGGVAAARNTGLAAATGPLIAFHDSDDICPSDRIELSVRALLALPEGYVGVYGMRLFYAQLDEASYHKVWARARPFPHDRPLSGDLAARTVEGNIINFPTLLVRAEAVRAAGPSDELLRKNVDWDLALRLTRQGRFGFVPEPLVLTPNSTDAAVNRARVSRSVRQGGRSFARITGKLRRQGHGQGPGRPALARHYATTAAYMIRMGRPRFARRFLRASLALDPLRPRLWARYALSRFPGLYMRLRRAAPRPPDAVL